MTTAPGTNGETGIDLGAPLRASWRARVSLVLLPLLAAGATYAVIAATPPVYRSEAKILIEGRATAERTGGGDIDTEIRLFGSREFARRVVDAAGLAGDTEFTGGGRLTKVLRLIGLGGGATAEDRAAEALAGRISVTRQDRSRLVTVATSANDPEKAARITTKAAELFVAATAEGEAHAAAEYERTTTAEIERLQREVAEADARVEARRGTGAGARTTPQQIGEIESQLTAARALRSESEARVRILKRLVDGVGNYDTAADILTSTTYQTLRERLAGLRVRAVELSSTYLANHPQVQTVRAQTAEVEGQIRAEAAKVLSGHEAELKSAEARVRQLTSRLDEARAKARSGEEDLQLQALQREAQVRRDRLAEYVAAHPVDGPAGAVAGSRIAEPATVPEAKGAMRALPPALAVGALTFLLLALRALWRALRSGAIRRRRAAEPSFVVPPIVPAEPARAVEIPAEATTAVATDAADAPAPAAAAVEGEATVPTTADAPVETVAAEDAAATVAPAPAPGDRDGDAAWSQARRRERSWREIADEAVEGQCIVVTSATSAEAAHRGALALLRTGARCGAKVCLVELVGRDADLAAAVGGGDVPGLSDHLAGRASVGDIILRDRRSRGHVVLGGRAGLEAKDLADDDLVGLVEALALSYDHLILDLGVIPPGAGAADLLASADAVILATDAGDDDADTEAAQRALASAGLASIRVMAVEGDVGSLAA